MTIEQKVREFIREDCFFDGEIPPGQSLTQNGALDSMGVLELFMFLEEGFNITIPDEDTIPENFDTIENIVRYVESALLPDWIR